MRRFRFQTSVVLATSLFLIQTSVVLGTPLFLIQTLRYFEDPPRSGARTCVVFDFKHRLSWRRTYIKISGCAKTGGKYSAPTILIDLFVIQAISIFLLKWVLLIILTRLSYVQTCHCLGDVFVLNSNITLFCRSPT